MWEKIKEIFLWIWFTLFVLILLLIFVWKEANGTEGIIFPISALIAWIVISVGVLFINDKKYETEKKQYHEKYIFKVELEDKKFGKMVFEKDSKINELTCEKINIAFGKYTPKIIIKGVDEKEIDPIFRNLEEIYNNQEKILKDYYNEIKDFCDNWEEKDFNGNPISEDYIKEKFDIDIIDITKDEEKIVITFWGMLSGETEDSCLLGDHSITAEINCKTKEVRYDLVG